MPIGSVPSWQAEAVADLMNRRVLLAQRPDGLVREDDFTHDEAPVPDPGEGEVLVRTEWIGIDATVRTWLSRAEGYIPPVEIGEVVRSSGIGRVLTSRSGKFAEGDLVSTLTGWQEYAVVGDDPMLTNPLPAIPITRAPRILAICTAIDPVAPAAADTTTVSPSLT